MHGGFMDNTEVNISQEIPAYERRYRKISEWFLNCKPCLLYTSDAADEL